MGRLYKIVREWTFTAGGGPLLDIVVSGYWVKNLQLTNGSSAGGLNLFRISGAGSLQGRDAAQAFIAAVSDPTVDDTYAEVPFVVEDTTPVPSRTRPAPLRYAPAGALLLIRGIAVWRRQ